MSALGLVLVLVLVLVLGCTGQNPIDSIKTQIEAKPAAQEIVNVIEAERKVQEYQAKHGENPPSIEALEASVGKLKTLPPGYKYTYDPATAKIAAEK